MTVSASGALTESVTVTIWTMGDDWDQVVSVPSPELRFATLTLRARSRSESWALHPRHMRFVPKGGHDAAIYAVSLDTRVDNTIVLRDVTSAQGLSLVPRIPTEEGTFQVVYLVDRTIEEGMFYFDGKPIGVVRFPH